MKRVSVVTTTINPVQPLVDEYLYNFMASNVQLNHLHFIIIGDHKTPRVIEEDLPNFVEYWTPRAQDKWLKKWFPSKFDLIKSLLVPENDMRRRNFGYLRAKELDSDVVITIDDDNFPLKNQDWLRGHLKALTRNHQSMHCSNYILNPCHFLTLNYDEVYSRGYPLDRFYSDLDYQVFHGKKHKTILNMGLWTHKPDVDSFTNILYPNLYSEGLIDDSFSTTCETSYFPINTQNTAFTKELCIFHNLYQEPGFLHRYDDIWMGLILQLLMKDVTNQYASFGSPLVEHRRNIHDYVKDFRIEFNGIVLNQNIWHNLMNYAVDSVTYEDGFLEIMSLLVDLHERDLRHWAFLNKMKESVELWVELIEKL